MGQRQMLFFGKLSGKGYFVEAENGLQLFHDGFSYAPTVDDVYIPI
jgi:hypothetical protein